MRVPKLCHLQEIWRPGGPPKTRGARVSIRKRSIFSWKASSEFFGAWPAGVLESRREVPTQLFVPFLLKGQAYVREAERIEVFPGGITIQPGSGRAYRASPAGAA